MGAAGTSGDSLNVEDVFSTFLYTGDTSAADDSQTLTTGIDLANEGGLLWIACRSAARGHTWVDTAQNTNLASSSPRAGATSHSITTTSTGFTLGNGDASYNNGTTPDTYCAWSFRKAPKFFDVVTYTGNGSARSIAHSLGSTPGMIIVKQINGTYSWRIWHRSLGNTKYLRFQTDTAGADNSYLHWSNGAHTDSIFRVGTNVGTNEANATYVAYLFAHNDDDGGFGSGGDQDIIKCGTFEATDAGNSATVSLGFEPQWILLKNVDSNSHWKMYDIMRGLPVTTPTGSIGAAELAPHSSDAETNIASSESIVGSLKVDTDGFSVSGGLGSTYIYVAIRFPNMKDVTAGTEVFGNITYTGNATDGRVITNDQTNRVDSVVIFDDERVSPRWFDRLQGIQYLMPKDDSAGINSTARLKSWASQNGVILGNNSQVNGNGETHTAFFWTRTKGCYDIVRYTGNFSGRNINHSLGVVPEMMIAKGHSSSQPWMVYHKDMDANNPQNYYAFIGTDAARVDDNGWNDTAPTASVFSVEGNESNKSNVEFTCWLYATLAGVTKVGTYTGNGGSLTVDCGFASTARYVMVKRILASGSWLVFSSAMGIVAGNEPAHYFDVGGDSGSGTDHIDPESSGFIVNSVGSDSKNPNHNGSKYIFYAVA